MRGDDGEGAVFLDVAVHAVVDVAAVAFVDVVLAPDGAEEDGEAHLGFFVFFGGEGVHDLRDGLEVRGFWTSRW